MILYLDKPRSFKLQNGHRSDQPESDVVGSRWSTHV